MSEKIDVCVDDKVVRYLNRRDVQKALHARLVRVRRWEACSEYFSDLTCQIEHMNVIDVVHVLIDSIMQIKFGRQHLYLMKI